MQQSFGLFAILAVAVLGIGVSQAPRAGLCRSDLANPSYVGGVDVEGRRVVPADTAPIPEVRLSDGRLLAEVPVGRSGSDRVWVPVEADVQGVLPGSDRHCGSSTRRK
jgi:hypothetical protein